MMTKYLVLLIAVPIVLALVVDGIEAVYRSFRYRKSQRVLKQFRGELRSLKPEKSNVGIAIPCYRNGQDLDACLDDLINNVGIAPGDIAVVDDFSDDNRETITVAMKYGVNTDVIARHEKDIRKVRAQKRAAAILCELGKEYIIAMDPDTFIKAKRSDLDYAIQEMKTFDLTAMAVCVLPKMNNRATVIEKYQKKEYLESMKAYRGSMYTISSNGNGTTSGRTALKEKYTLERAGILCVSGACGIFKSHFLLELLQECKSWCGGEDSEITWRALAKNAKIGYHDDIVVETIVPPNLKSFTKQRDLWAQYLSSHYFNAPYTLAIYKNRKEKSGLGVKESIALQTARDFLIHPIKIICLPFLLLQPIIFVAFYAFYALLSLITSHLLGKKDKNISLDFVIPLFRLYVLAIPTTVGYFNQARRWLVQKF